LVPDNEFGGPVTNIDVPFKTIIQYMSRSGLSGEGLIFFEEEQSLRRIPVISSHDPALHRIARDIPFAIVNRQQKEIEIVWEDFTTTLIKYGETVEIKFENEHTVWNSSVVLRDNLNRILMKKIKVIKGQVGTVRVLLDSDLEDKVIFAVKLYDGVWEMWNGERMEPTYLLREDNEVLRFFIDKKPQPTLIYGHVFSFSSAGPHPNECGSEYVESVGNYYIMTTKSWELKTYLSFEDIPNECTWYYLVPVNDGAGLGFYVDDLQYCEQVAEMLTEAEE
jgi:hypothetical protein